MQKVIQKHYDHAYGDYNNYQPPGERKGNKTEIGAVMDVCSIVLSGSSFSLYHPVRAD